MSTIVVSILVGFLSFAGVVFSHTVGTRPVSKVIAEPGWASKHLDRAWEKIARYLVLRCGKKRDEIKSILVEQLRTLPKNLELAEINEAETSTSGTYGVLPEVDIDVSQPSLFPLPWSVPIRSSWFGVAKAASRYLKAAQKREKIIVHWTRLSREEKIKNFSEVESAWNTLVTVLPRISGLMRYVETWSPILEREWDEASIADKVPLGFQVTKSIASRDSSQIWEWSELLRPHRVIHPSFLPQTIDHRSVIIPIVTDINNRRFLSEVEGALAIHWNQSAWAKEHGTTFHIHWSFIPKDQDFLAGRIDLTEHLRRFPVDKAGMTTGGLTHYVKKNILVLGPDHLTPRTLAHEIGHLMGFDDCYIKAINSEGIFGLSVLDWSNPLFPDDLMCDNNVGVPRAEVW